MKESGPCPCTTKWKTGEYHHSDCPEAKKLRDSWCSPSDVTELLPEVDLDPASNLRSLVKAKRAIVWNESKDGVWIRGQGLAAYRPGDRDSVFVAGDGLKIEWNGTIFLNGPYSDMLPFIAKANEEWGAKRLNAAIFLVKLDPTTRWWAGLVKAREEKCLQVWLPRKRLQHIPPPRIKASTNNFASAIVHWRRPMRADFWDLRLDSIADRWT